MRFSPAYLCANALLAVFLILLSSCAHTAPTALTATTAPTAPDNAVVANATAPSGYIDDVPFFPQDTTLCGPAAIASVSGYWGKPIALNEAMHSLYVDKVRGALPVDLLIFAKEKGFSATFYNGSIEDLKEKIRDKTPLILFINVGLDSVPIGHYLTVVGYDDSLEIVYAHSGMDEAKIIPYEDLTADWSKTGNLTLLVSP